MYKVIYWYKAIRGTAMFEDYATALLFANAMCGVVVFKPTSIKTKNIKGGNKK